MTIQDESIDVDLDQTCVVGGVLGRRERMIVRQHQALLPQQDQSFAIVWRFH
jgi:hypothetical protein